MSPSSAISDPVFPTRDYQQKRIKLKNVASANIEFVQKINLILIEENMSFILKYKFDNSCAPYNSSFVNYFLFVGATLDFAVKIRTETFDSLIRK